MVELMDKTAQPGREIESCARSLGAEIYSVASAAIYEKNSLANRPRVNSCPAPGQSSSSVCHLPAQ